MDRFKYFFSQYLTKDLMESNGEETEVSNIIDDLLQYDDEGYEIPDFIKNILQFDEGEEDENEQKNEEYYNANDELQPYEEVEEQKEEDPVIIEGQLQFDEDEIEESDSIKDQPQAYEEEEQKEEEPVIIEDQLQVNEEEIENFNVMEDTKRCCFCTIVSNEYLIKVVAFYYSLERTSKNFHLWICCIDDKVYSSLSRLNLKHASIIHVSAVEDKKLLAVKNMRKINEYCWTLKAAVSSYVLMKCNAESVIYCDSDMFFFSDPQVVFDEWGEASIFLCPQRDLEWVHKMYGKFQAGFIGFKKDREGVNCLNWWNKKCIEWCYGEPDSETGRWGDQKYLDEIPGLFSSVKISENLGVDAAPWNTIYNNNFNITSRDNEVFIEGDKLISYHFACLSIFNEDDYDLWTFNYLTIRSAIKHNIYISYIESIRNAINIIKSSLNEDTKALFSKSDSKGAQTFFKYSDLTLNMARYDEYYNFCTITSKEYLIRCMALYISLKDRINNFNLMICCMDETSFSTLSNLKLENTTIINISEVEDAELLSVKKERSIQEYCWSTKATLVLYILEKYGVDSVIYCDADIFFFSDPEPIFKLWKNYDTLICNQRYPEFEHEYGRFQAGFLGFSNRKTSLDILNWWKEKCIDWCSAKHDSEMDRWGDQKYLDQVPNLFSSIKILNDLGIDAAPWNLIINNDYKVYKENNTVLIDGSELMVYHFGSMEIFDESTFDLWKLDPLIFSKEIIDNIYIPYVHVLKRAIEVLKKSGWVDVKELFSKEEVTKAKNLYRL
ncbi:putative nucleotide-diphospho-sugar transferase [Clostridium vincentii]|nr:putative nucleotide-diphospho-sugar transferase [Clostridium vincentii]